MLAALVVLFDEADGLVYAIGKVRRDTQTEERAIEQVAAYLDSLGLAEGWLIVFDLRSTQPWSERLWNKDVEHAGKRIHLVGC